MGGTTVEVPVLVAVLSTVEKAKDCMKTMYLIIELEKRKTEEYPSSLRLRIL